MVSFMLNPVISAPAEWAMTRGKNSKSYKYHFPIPHRPPGVVSFCFDDHVHDDHLVRSGCHAQSRLALLLRIQEMQQNSKTFIPKVKFRKTFFICFHWQHYVTATVQHHLTCGSCAKLAMLAAELVSILTLSLIVRSSPAFRSISTTSILAISAAMCIAVWDL